MVIYLFGFLFVACIFLFSCGSFSSQKNCVNTAISLFLSCFFSSFIIWGLTGVIPERAMFRRTIFFFFNSGDDCSGKQKCIILPRIILRWKISGLLWILLFYKWIPWVHAKSFSCVQLFVTLWAIAHQAPLSMGLSRQEYWRGVLCPPGDLPNPGIEPESLALTGRFFTTSATWVASK